MSGYFCVQYLSTLEGAIKSLPGFVRAPPQKKYFKEETAMYRIELNNRIFSVTADELNKLRAKGVKPSFAM